MDSVAAPGPSSLPPSSGPAAQSRGQSGDGSLDVWDLLDIINPLQHLPFISTLYRDLTGDQIKPALRIVGGGLFGGPIGAAIAMVNAVIADASGKDIGQHLLALATGRPDTPPDPRPAVPASQEAAVAAGGAPAARGPATRVTGATPAAVARPWIDPALLLPFPATTEERDDAGRGVAAAMADALDKYDAMVSARRQAGEP